MHLVTFFLLLLPISIGTKMVEAPIDNDLSITNKLVQYEIHLQLHERVKFFLFLEVRRGESMCITDDIRQIMMLGELMEACNSHIEPALLHLDR